MPETSTSDIITLFCLVFGDKEPFSVKISREQSVHELKKAIVAEQANSLRGIDASKLMLWTWIMTSKEIKNLQLSDFQEDDKLDATYEIREYFEDAAPKHRIHIIVVAPTSK